jgi:hypothetical protein
MKHIARPLSAGTRPAPPRESRRATPRPACLVVVVVALLLGLAACGHGSPSGGGSPSPSSSRPPGGSTVASPAPTPPPVHPPSAGERRALAKAAAIVDNPQTSEEKQHLKGYTGKGARIVGYLVQSRAPGFTVDLLVSLTTNEAQPPGPQFGLQPWATAAAKSP